MGENYTLHLVPLGEVKMGTNGFGIRIRTASTNIDCLEKEAVFWRPGHETDTSWLNEALDHSSDKQFLIITGTFSTYIVNLPEGTLCLYKDTIRSADGIWSEETPISGREIARVNGKKQHYYLQYPFVKASHFLEERTEYHALRLQQIRSLKERGELLDPGKKYLADAVSGSAAALACLFDARTAVRQSSLISVEGGTVGLFSDLETRVEPPTAFSLIPAAIEIAKSQRNRSMLECALWLLLVLVRRTNTTEPPLSLSENFPKLRELAFAHVMGEGTAFHEIERHYRGTLACTPSEG